MKIIFLNHHEDFQFFSMVRYATFLSEGMRRRGHDTEIWAPKPFLTNNNLPESIKKWLRYVDSFVLFPLRFKIQSRKLPKNTLYVLVDQALGMWMPLLRNHNHVVHCHDFIALKSALGQIKENPTSRTGKAYQRLILNGFSKADNFICISQNTQKELLGFLGKDPLRIDQVYNALEPAFKPGDIEEARTVVGNFVQRDLKAGYILNVGGNGFYKNRIGVIALYTAWREQTQLSLPLLMIGYRPSANIQAHYEASPYKKDIHFLVQVSDELLLKGYQGASVFVFPSLAEGFGWPIAEALAAGCPVITTDAAPMNEVGGKAAAYIERCPSYGELPIWATESAKVLEVTLRLGAKERATLIQKGLDQAHRFNGEGILDRIERIYKDIIG
ncbi:glycosyltransferase family 4 protein [Maribacter polysaccharolyticus]|uniref:glycosyltransferase family 4 protein n=1 Tax=Maribacter polysaccharolyticus TaxID=3020831 RepID=UPI00237F2ADE|nr:glycosyltransferase family 1 protein [Maribacter polysaccharolyticus]MDE3741478.1 glycosyltransferase family 1 protein [Maribacter polysaccharolyticus]